MVVKDLQGMHEEMPMKMYGNDLCVWVLFIVQK